MPILAVSDTLGIYYETHGAGTPLVFINGLTSSLECWSNQVTVFSARYRVIVYDCRGQGRSGKPSEGYTGYEHMTDLMAILDHLSIDKAHLVGHSFGGYIALYLAAHFPGRVRSLVVSDTTTEAHPLLEKTMLSWIEAQDKGDLDLRFDVALPWLYSNSFIKHHDRKINIFKKVFRRNDREALKSNTIESLKYNATVNLQEVKSPLLLIVGEEDLLTPPRYAQRIHHAVQGSKLKVIEDCGHVPPIEKPLQFNEALLSFLSLHDPPLTDDLAR
ncbi:MAG: alpha/beta fold hydrolase [Candidatus Eremiobacteraeota bacterium]|nr:alpha/beta fold hydrolase [Candidatus Eremiobacteraeota bacterium]